VFIQRHEIQFDLTIAPTANGRTLACVFCEAKFVEAFAESRVLKVRSYFGDGVDIESGTDFGGGLIGNKQTGGTTSYKNQFIENRPQQLRRDDEKLQILVSHEVYCARVF